MTSEQYYRCVCDRCGVTVELSTLSAYYAGNSLPVEWKRLSMFETGAYYDLCPECQPQLAELVEDWMQGGGPSDDYPYRIEDTCCGKCSGACAVDQITGA